MLVVCPHCNAANRVPPDRASDDPVCGKCGAAILGGAPIALDEARFDRFVARSDLPVVVDFWASWCAPCRQEEGPLKAAAQRLQGRVAFLGVDFRDSPAAARATQDRAQYPYPVGPAADGVSALYGVTAPPETFFLDGRGLVLARFVGPLDTSLIDRYLQLVGVG